MTSTLHQRKGQAPPAVKSRDNVLPRGGPAWREGFSPDWGGGVGPARGQRRCRRDSKRPPRLRRARPKNTLKCDLILKAWSEQFSESNLTSASGSTLNSQQNTPQQDELGSHKCNLLKTTSTIKSSPFLSVQGRTLVRRKVSSQWRIQDFGRGAAEF